LTGIALLLAIAPVVRAQMPTLRVVVEESREIDAAETVTLVGTVEPYRRSRISAEVAGKVIAMPVRQGDAVARGDVLVKLDDQTTKLELAQAEARLSALESRHEELLAGTRPEELARLKAMAEEAEADFKRWTKEWARVQKLYENRESNEKEVYDTRAEFLRARGRMEAAQAQYEEALAGPRKEVIAQAAHEVAAQKAVVDKLRSDLSKLTTRAPFDGYIVSRTVEVGEWVTMGGTVAEMVELSRVLVNVDAPERALPFLEEGATVRVMIDALGYGMAGRIKHIIRQADRAARTFPVEIEIDNEEGKLAAGMFARATLPAGPSQRIVAVPTDAVVERDGTSYIARVIPHRDGPAGVLMPVTVGLSKDDWIAVTSRNVEPGTPVIVEGNENIAPFPTPIQIVDERGTPVAFSFSPKPEGDGGQRRAPASGTNGENAGSADRADSKPNGQEGS